MVMVFAPLLVVCSGAKGLLTRRTNSHEDMAFVPCSAANKADHFGWSFRGAPKLSERASPKSVIPWSPARLGPGMTGGSSARPHGRRATHVAVRSAVRSKLEEFYSASVHLRIFMMCWPARTFCLLACVEETHHGNQEEETEEIG